MRFCFVFDGLGCGGIERVGIDYCNALVERGYGVTVVNLVPAMDEFASQLSGQVRYVTRKFPRSLAPERYCTLISRAAWGRFVYPLAYVACTAAVAAKRPFLRGGLGEFDVAVAFSGHYNDLTFVASGCVKAAKRLAWLHGTVNGYALVNEGYMNLYKHFDTLVCLSDEGIEEFRDAKHWLDLPLRKLYNPIDLDVADIDEAKVKELRDSYGDFILMVARLASPKDPKTLIDAVGILKEKYGIERNCVILGDGPDMERVEQYAAASPVASLVHLAGYESEPAPYYDACSTFVLSSLNEGLPTVLLEAMAHGKPVISTNVPGAREILENGKDGVLCGIGDAEGMAFELSRLLGNEAYAAQCVEAGLKRIRDFEKGTIIRSFIDMATRGQRDEDR